MPALVTASQLRAVLGVSVFLYSDADLNNIIETAEDAIGDFLVQWNAAIYQHKNEGIYEYVKTVTPHKFYEGQTVVITGVHANANGSKTIVEIVDPYTFNFETSGQPITDYDWRNLIPHGKAAANDLTQYDGVDAVEEAVLQVSIDVFQSRLAAGGTQQALDYTP